MTTAVLCNARIATLAGPDCGLLADGAVVVDGEHIAWVGSLADLPG